MLRTFLFVLAVVALGLVQALADMGGPGSDTQKIEQLVAQLGSPMFMEREAAAKALDAIGAPALAALKKAATDSDPETRRRAEELVARIEQRLFTEALLKPTKVQLAVKDMPIPEAVAELATKSGYRIALAGGPAKFQDRKVTLDTGETTYWQALDELCRAAGLVESNGIEVPLQPAVRPVPRPGVPAQPMADTAAQVVLTDGKATGSPACYKGAARIRASTTSAPAVPNEIAFCLSVSLEPRVALENIGAVHVVKALDDQGQDHQQVMGAAAPAPARPVFIVNNNARPVALLPTADRDVVVKLQSADKPCKTLKELTGSLAVSVRAPTEPLMTIDNVLKAIGKSVNGKEGGALTLHEFVKQDDGQYRVRVELALPAGPNAIAPGLQIQIQPRALPGTGFVHDPMGISLVDDKGLAIPVADVLRRAFKLANTGASHELTLLFKPQAKQGEPAKIQYSARRVVNIEVPFTLKDVTLAP